tara:strand:- start:4635 stop:5021 length:387 start_codon:yes stop_codon:yes gene_type:complete
MAAIDKDTRLVMTIMYVGAVSGLNVYFYSVYGAQLPFPAISHAILFSLITVGVIMLQKALFDLAVNERLETWLLNRKIDMYWQKKNRDEQQRQKIRETMSSRNLSYYRASGEGGPYDEVSEQFLKALE